VPLRTSPRGKRRITYDNFEVRAGDPAIIQTILGREQMNIEQEITKLNPQQFDAFKNFVSKQASMPRVVEHCTSNDLHMRALEVK
jgi:hypothetical protein